MYRWTKALAFIFLVVCPIAYFIMHISMQSFEDKDTGFIVGLALDFILGYVAGGFASYKWLIE